MEERRIRVLVVDDHALHREGTRQILANYPDLEVVGDAESAEVALALVNQLDPAVVLMDLRLPGMNGIEATRRLRHQHPVVRVLVVTAYEDGEYVRSALAAGASGYLSKTAPGRELVEAIRSVAVGNVVLEPRMLAPLLAEVPAAHRAQRGPGLSEREQAVLQLLAEGMQNKQIATTLGISPRTVERHCDSIYGKLGVSSRTEAVVRAVSTALVEVPRDDA